MNQSPDPLQTAYQQSTVQHPVTLKKKRLTSRVTKILTGIGALFVVLVVIGMFMDEETYVDDIPQEPYSNQQVQQDPNQFVAPAPANFSATEIRTKMQQLFNSGEELDENDLMFVDPEFLQRQLANTSWYENNLNYLTFDASGASGSYLNGNGLIEITYGTQFGFWVGTYTELTTGDGGYVGIVPPGTDQQLTVYIESQVTPGISGFIELQRR